MDRSQFTEEASGKVIRAGGASAGYLAFVPDPLPPAGPYVEPGQYATLLSAADRAIGMLAGVGQVIPNPHLLMLPFMRREAVLSSRIEGTQASLSDLFLFEAGPTDQPQVGDVREVHNYVVSLEYGLSRVSTLPLTKRLLREMHEKLLQGVRGSYATPGEFRRTQNWIGPSGCTLNDAVYVPPPPDQMQDCLDDLEKFLHAPSGIPALLRHAMIHYQFEAIHPFIDGNGRIGRLLVTLLLCTEAILPKPLLYLSAYFDAHRSEYYERLLRVSTHGEWNEWFQFYLRGVAQQASDASDRAQRLVQLRSTYHERLQHQRGSMLTLRLVDELFGRPAMNMPTIAKLLEVTPKAAQHHINRLIEADILREVTGRKRNRLYFAHEIASAVT